MRQINAAVLGEGWRLLERHEEIKDGDQTGCASLLMSTREFEEWKPVADFAIGMTVAAALDGDGDARERLYRRRVLPAVTSSDVERAATLAWNEAVEKAAEVADGEEFDWDVGASIARAIRALKRTT